MANYNSSSAYKFELFEEKSQRTEPEFKVIRNKQLEKAQHRNFMLRTVVYVAVFFVGIISILFNQIAITELTNQVSVKTSELEQLENEYRMLSAELEGSVALSNIESIITRDLGMAKLSEDQISYINLSEGDMMTVPEESSSIFSELWTAITGEVYRAS